LSSAHASLTLAHRNLLYRFADRLPVLDNYAAHKHPKVRTWLDRHQRFTFHFTPTSCSWLNAVEGFFAKLSKCRLKRGVFHSVVDLQAAINRYLAEHNRQPKPFVWIADPDEIIAAVKRGHQVLDSAAAAALRPGELRETKIAAAVCCSGRFGAVRTLRQARMLGPGSPSPRTRRG
jgi:transposase